TVSVPGVMSNQATLPIGTTAVTANLFQRGGGPPGGTVSVIQFDPLYKTRAQHTFGTDTLTAGICTEQLLSAFVRERGKYAVSNPLPDLASERSVQRRLWSQLHSPT